MATETKSTSKATSKSAPKRSTKTEAKGDTAAAKPDSVDDAQTDTTTEPDSAEDKQTDTTAESAPADDEQADITTEPAPAEAKGKNGYVVEELDNGLVSVYPTDSADFTELAGKLISSAKQPEEVQTRSMPRRFVVPADLAKKSGLL